MATGASNSELAVILIDARKGVLVQSPAPRLISLHCWASGMFVLAVNKIDLVDSARRRSTPSSVSFRLC